MKNHLGKASLMLCLSTNKGKSVRVYTLRFAIVALLSALFVTSSAQAAYIYNFFASPHPSAFGNEYNGGQFIWKSPSLLSANGGFLPSDLIKCTSSSGACVGGEFYVDSTKLGSPGMGDFADAVNLNGKIYYFPNGSLSSTGTSQGNWIGDSVARLTVTDTTSTSAQIDFSKSVSLNAFDTLMSASFIPSNGMSLSEAAASLGYDHFNWVQVITRYDSLLFHNTIPTIVSLPTLDPPSGGYINHPADTLPYYWDEEAGAEPGYHIDDQTVDDFMLLFADEPHISGIPLSLNPMMSFTTSLVGVTQGSAWDPLFTWEWISDYVYGDGKVTTNGTRSLPKFLLGSGGILEYQILDNPTDVSAEVQGLWRENGWSSVTTVPEPSSLVLLGLGLAGLGFSRRKRTLGCCRFRGTDLS